MQLANWFQHVKRNNAKMQCRLHYWMHKQLHMHMKEQHVIAIVDVACNFFVVLQFKCKHSKATQESKMANTNALKVIYAFLS